MTLDLKIVGGTLVTARMTARAGLGVKDGAFVTIADDAYLPDADEVVDATGRYVLPGAVDAHVHTRDPGRTALEDFESATRAAAAGGVTTIIDMPGTDIPILRDVAALENKARAVGGRSHVDFALRGAIVPDNLDEMAPLAAAGVAAFKVQMGQSVYSPIVNDAILLESFRRAAAVGRPMGVHAESNALMSAYAEDLQRQGRRDPLAHYESRPGIVEDEAVNRALFYTQVAGNRLHVHHVGSAAAAAQIAQAKAGGVAVTAETCPHYLLLSTDDYASLGNLMRVNPSIKTPADRDGLWRHLLDGTIDTLGSDHAPHSDDEKLEPDVWKAVSGWAGLETLVPLMLTEVSRGRLPWQRFVDAVAEQPARIFGLYPRKGTLEIGADADIAVVDPAAEWTIDQRRLHSRNPITPFHGRSVTGQVVLTIVRGVVVARDGIVEGPPRGRFVPVMS